MKKTSKFTVVLLILVVLATSCKQKKIETFSEQIMGKWTAQIEDSIINDSIIYTSVEIELKENNIALVNYCGENGDRWATPYEYKWWIEEHRAFYPFSFYESHKKDYFFLFLKANDIYCDPCYSKNSNVSFYPNTTTCQIVNYEPNKMTVSTSGSFITSGDFVVCQNDDLLI